MFSLLILKIRIFKNGIIILFIGIFYLVDNFVNFLLIKCNLLSYVLFYLKIILDFIKFGFKKY